MRNRGDDRPATALFFGIVTILLAAFAHAQAPPIVGSAPVLVRPASATPQTADTFSVDLAVDLTNTSGNGPSGGAPAALSAFRIRVAFDRTRLQLTAVGAGQDPLFAPAGLDATPVAAANASGSVVVTATLAGGLAPSGIVSVATLTFQATSAGPAGIAADITTTSLASAIQGAAATLFGPAAIAPRATGGGVVVQTPPSLRATVSAGPSPINTNGRLVYTIRVENTGGAAASGVIVSAAIPSNTTFLAASSGGTQAGGNVQWTAGNLAGGSYFEASFAVTVTGAAGTTISALSATATATNAGSATATSSAVDIVAKAIVKPGSIVTMTSYGAQSGTIYDVTTGTPKQFGQISSAGWAGALHFTAEGTLYATSNAYGGAVFDATAGGDLRNAAPIARNLGNRITGIATDGNGNLYIVPQESGVRIKRIARDGTVSELPPLLNFPAGLLAVGNTLYVSEGQSGSVKKIDLATNAISNHVTGFPTGDLFFSGQLVRIGAGRIYVLWGQTHVNRGLFEITFPGVVNMNAPVTAAGAFRIDVNQLAADAGNAIYFGGDGSGAVYRALPNGSNYFATQIFADGVTEAESLTIYPRPQATLLVLSAAASLTETYAGRDIVYTLSYENAGATAAPTAALTFNIPSGTTFVSASNSGTASGSVVTWNLGSVGGGATGMRTVTVKTTAPGGTTLNSTASVTGGGSSATANLPPVTVLVPPILSVILEASATSVPLNSHVVYTIRYSNTGGATAADTIIRNTIPSGSQFAGVFNGGTVPGPVEWNIGALPAGASGSVSFAVRATGAVNSSINNNGCTIFASGITAVAATPVVTTIAASTNLTATMRVGPSPVIPGTQINAFITYANAGSPVATNVVLTAPLPPNAELLSSTGNPVLSGNTLTWTIASVASGPAIPPVRYSFRINAAPGFTTFLAATIRSDQHAAFTTAPRALEVRALPQTYVPGTVLSGETYINAQMSETHNVRIVGSNGFTGIYATPPLTNWLGSLHIAGNRHLYAVTKWPVDADAALWDLTAGGDLKNASPVAEGLGGDIVDMTSDDAGNIYCVRRLTDDFQRIRKITPNGEVSIIGPEIHWADSLLWLDGWIYYSEGFTGKILKFDPLTYDPVTNNVIITHASGFEPGRDHFSGHFVRNQQGRLYVLWAQRQGNGTGLNRGLFDITEPGFVWTSAAPPVTAKNAFIVDMNEMGVNLDNSIWFAGNGSRGIWRAPYVNGAYGPTVRVGNFDAGDNEALVIVPPLDLSIAAVSVPSRALSGDTLTWTLTWTNDSGTTVHNGYVESPVPSGAAFLAAANGGTLANGIIRWNIGTLLPHATGSVSFTTRATAIEGANVTLQNYFVDGDEVVGSYGSAVNVLIERPLAIGATAQPSPVIAGQNVTFTLRYENLNANAATNTVIRATVPAGATYVSGGVFSGGEVTFNLGTVNAGVAGEVAFVVRADTVPSIALDVYSVTTAAFGTRLGSALVVPVLPLPVALRVSASAADSVTSGETLTYTIGYANDGGSTATQTQLSSIIPAGTAFAASTGGGALTNGIVVWNLGALAAGAAGSVSFDVTVTAAGGTTITNNGVTIVSGTQARTAGAVVTDVIAPAPPPPLGVSIDADPSPVIAGELLSYSVTVTNTADESAADVIVTTLVPDNTSFVTSSNAATASDDGTLQWTLGALAAAEARTLTFSVRVDAGAGAQIVSDGATAFATGRDAASSGPLTTNVIHPPSALRLTISAPASVPFGSNINYTLSFANDGPLAASAVKLADPLPAGTTLVSASNSGVLTDGIVTWNLGNLGAGQSGTRTLTLATTQPPGSTIANSGATLSTAGSPTAYAATVLTSIAALPLDVHGTLTTDKNEYFVPELVEQRATFTYQSGGLGLLDGVTATLVTTNAGGGVVASHEEPLAVLTRGSSASIAFDWSTATAASGQYAITFTATDAGGATLFTRSTNVTIHARDGAGLTGTIAAPNSPVPLGGTLRANFTVANASRFDYDPLALSILVTDDATGAPVLTVPVNVPLPANGDFASHVSIPTLDLSLGEHGLWLVTTDGGGRLLASTTFVVAAPLLTLEPSAITIAAGASGSLIAALSAPAGAPVTLTLTSSNPSIASVPASITIAADATNVTIPVQGVAIGGPVTITAAMPASLGGASASSTVLVVADGSITATLQVYQGENVSFAVTIRNSGATALVNAPFTIDIVDPNSGNAVDTIPLTVTVAAGETFQTTLQHDTSTLAFQQYAAKLVFLGVTPRQVIAQAPFTVLEPPPVRLETAVASLARVLIWTNCSPGNSNQPCTPVPPPFLTQTLQAARIPYVVAGNEETFLAQLRTGAFTAVVMDELSAAEPHSADEYLHDFHAGTGLLFIHSSPDAMPKLSAALGVRFEGKRNGPTTLDLLATPFTSAGTLTLNGDRTRLELETAHAAANAGTGPGTGAAMAYNEYGRGRVVTIPFDLELTPTLDVARLILSSIQYISRPAGPEFTAREVVPVHIAVTTPPGGQLPVAIALTLSNGITIVDAVPPLTSTNPLQWTANIAGNTTATFDLWVRLPDVLGTATLSVTASLPGGPPIVTKTVEFNVTADAATLRTALQTQLTTLRAAATGNSDVRDLDDALAALAQINGDAGANVTRVLLVLEKLGNVSLDTSAARAAADRLLVYWQGKVV